MRMSLARIVRGEVAALHSGLRLIGRAPGPPRKRKTRRGRRLGAGWILASTESTSKSFNYVALQRRRGGDTAACRQRRGQRGPFESVTRFSDCFTRSLDRPTFYPIFEQALSRVLKAERQPAAPARRPGAGPAPPNSCTVNALLPTPVTAPGHRSAAPPAPRTPRDRGPVSRPGDASCTSTTRRWTSASSPAWACSPCLSPWCSQWSQWSSPAAIGG